MFINITLLALAGGVAGLLGGLLFLFNDKLARIICGHAEPFAAGILLTVSLVHLIPEASHELGDLAFTIVLLSFLASFLTEHLFFNLHHHDHDDHHKGHKTSQGSVALVLIGDTLHNFIDGVAIAAAYLVSPSLGVVVTLSSFLHETPHELADFAILLSAGYKKSKAIIINALSALSTVIGAWVVIFFLQDNSSEGIVAILLAIAAGMFLYLGATDFLPHGERQSENMFRQIISLLIGIIVMYLLFTFLPEAHVE